ncbi:hypothetical protein HK098_004604, partial [Nowakowskiella sp. JEL0407]
NVQFVPVDDSTEFISSPEELAASVKSIRSVPLNVGSEVESDPSAYIPGQGVVLDFGKMVDILAPHLTSNDEETQATALRWINEFILLAKEVLIPFTPMLINAILPSLAHSVTHIRNIAAETNANLYRLIWETQEEIPISTVSMETPAIEEEAFAVAAVPAKLLVEYQPVVETLTAQFRNNHEETRIASMEWLLMLHRKSPKKVISSDETTFAALLKALSDTSEEVVKRDLELLAQISQYSDVVFFSRFMLNMLMLFSSDRRLLETRGSLIIRQLCLSLDPERIYVTFAEILENNEVLDLEFISTMVQNLNIILITAPELSDLRRRLRNLDSRDGTLLFTTLYRSWCHNPVAAFSLCLLAQSYEHAANLLQIFAELEITVNLLVQIDKLVQLLESPVFTYLRLQLLEPDKYPYLYKCLYGILMLLPQSSAFATLKNRLNSVSSMGILQHSGQGVYLGGYQAPQQYYTQVPQQPPPTSPAQQQQQQQQQPGVPTAQQQYKAPPQQNRPKYGGQPTYTTQQQPTGSANTNSANSSPIIPALTTSSSIRSQRSNDNLKWQDLLMHFRGVQAGHDRHRRFGVTGRQSTLSLDKIVRQQQQQRRPLSFRGDASIDSIAYEDAIQQQPTSQLQSESTSPQQSRQIASQPIQITLNSPGHKGHQRSISASSLASSNGFNDGKSGVGGGSGNTPAVVSSMTTLLEEQRNSAGSRASSASSYVGSKRSDSRNRGEKNTGLSGIVKKLTGATSSQSKK